MLPISKKNNTRKKVCFGALSIKYYFLCLGSVSCRKHRQVAAFFPPCIVIFSVTHKVESQTIQGYWDMISVFFHKHVSNYASGENG